MHMSARWSELLRAAERQPMPLRKTLSFKPGLEKNFQNLPVHFENVLDEDLAEATDAKLKKMLVRSAAKEDRTQQVERLIAETPGLTVLAAGVFGVACKLAPRNLPYLQWLWDSLKGRVAFSTLPPADRPLIVKFVRVSSVHALKEVLRETRLQHWLSNAVLPASARLPEVRGRDIVPFMHLAGLGRFASKSWFVSVMGLASGVTLEGHLRHHRLTAVVFARIEKVVCSMWLLGIAHADLHFGNIMVGGGGAEVTLLDLGFAVKLPAPLVTELRRRVTVVTDPAKLYTDLVRHHVSSVIYQRDATMSWYNPDDRVLRHLYNEVVDKANILQSRFAVWTAPAAP